MSLTTSGQSLPTQTSQPADEHSLSVVLLTTFHQSESMATISSPFTVLRNGHVYALLLDSAQLISKSTPTEQVHTLPLTIPLRTDLKMNSNNGPAATQFYD